MSNVAVITKLLANHMKSIAHLAGHPAEEKFLQDCKITSVTTRHFQIKIAGSSLFYNVTVDQG
jgi:hypothetical protein